MTLNEFELPKGGF